MIDLTWVIFIAMLIASGLWTKRQNTKHIRKLAKDKNCYCRHIPGTDRIEICAWCQAKDYK